MDPQRVGDFHRAGTRRPFLRGDAGFAVARGEADRISLLGVNMDHCCFGITARDVADEENKAESRHNAGESGPKHPKCQI